MKNNFGSQCLIMCSSGMVFLDFKSRTCKCNSGIWWWHGKCVAKVVTSSCSMERGHWCCMEISTKQNLTNKLKKCWYLKLWWLWSVSYRIIKYHEEWTGKSHFNQEPNGVLYYFEEHCASYGCIVAIAVAHQEKLMMLWVGWTDLG